MSVLLSTSYLDEAERCNEVVLMHEGHILGQGKPASFSRDLKGHCFLLTTVFNFSGAQSISCRGTTADFNPM